MKKLLQWLAMTTIIGINTANLIACGTNNKNQKFENKNEIHNGRDSPSLIISRIKNKNINVPLETNPNTQNPNTKIALNQALKSVNPGLTSADLSTLTYSKVTLVTNQAVSVTVTSSYQDSTPPVSTSIKVTLLGKTEKWSNLSPSQDTPKGIINKIKNKALTVPSNTNPSTTNSQTITALNQALKNINPTLTEVDLSTLTYSAATLVAGQAVSVTVISKYKDTQDQAQTNLQVTLAKPLPPVSGSILSGYWYGWTNGATPNYLSMKDVNPSYNVINVSFWYNEQKPTEIPVLDPNIIKHSSQIKASIQAQHAQGHHVLLSLGGATGGSMKWTMSQAPAFEEALTKVLDEYQFDGLDIDLEGASQLANTSGDNLQLLSKVLPDIYNKWKAEGKHFYITMAPEYPNLRAVSTSIYPQLIKNLAPYYAWIQPQIYNQGGDGINVTEADTKALNVPYYLSNSDEQNRAKFLYLIMKYLTEDSDKNNNFAVQIPANKLLLGLPATTNAAGSGYSTAAQIEGAYQLMQQYKLGVNGLMTWAVNYDALNKWDYANTYNHTWGNN